MSRQASIVLQGERRVRLADESAAISVIANKTRIPTINRRTHPIDAARPTSQVKVAPPAYISIARFRFWNVVHPSKSNCTGTFAPAFKAKNPNADNARTHRNATVPNRGGGPTFIILMG